MYSKSKKFLLICSLFVFLQVSCASSITIVTLEKSIPSECPTSHPTSRFIPNQPADDCFTIIISNRYLSNKGVSGSLKLIYDYAVNSVKNSNYSEALVLFGVLANIESSKAAAYNNMGVVYELMNDRVRALEMYSKANMLADCIYFRENYLACLYAKP